MARLDFPSNPTEGQEYTANGTTWVFTNDKWIVSVPEPVVSINDLSDATSNTSSNFISLGFGAVSNPASSVTAVGIGALSSLTSGTHNTALGTNSASAAYTGSYNTAIGASAIFGDT